jgi:hypothetical protein
MRRLLQVSAVAAVVAATMAALPVGAATQGVGGQSASYSLQAADAWRVRRVLQHNPIGSLPSALRSSAASTVGSGQVAAHPTTLTSAATRRRSGFEHSPCPIEFPPELTVDCGALTAPETDARTTGARSGYRSRSSGHKPQARSPTRSCL